MMRGRSSWSSKLRVSVGEPASRSKSAPTSRSVSACTIASSSSTAPCWPRPTWQCASTRPDTIQPPSNTVCASLTGSALSVPSTIHHSADCPSGSPRPRTCSVICSSRKRSSPQLLVARELQLRQVDVGQAGGQFVKALRHVGQIREAGGHTRGKRVARLRRSRPAHLFTALLPLLLVLGGLAGRTFAAERHSHLAGHLRHHLAGLEEPVDELIDLADRHTRPVGDAQPAGAVDDLRVGPLG